MFSPVSTDPNKFWPHFHHAILCTCDWADPGAERCWRRFDIFCQPYGRKANHAWPESVERVHRISISLKATNPACSNIINPLIQERPADNFSLMLRACVMSRLNRCIRNSNKKNTPNFSHNFDNCFCLFASTVQSPYFFPFLLSSANCLRLKIENLLKLQLICAVLLF